MSYSVAEVSTSSVALSLSVALSVVVVRRGFLLGAGISAVSMGGDLRFPVDDWNWGGGRGRLGIGNGNGSSESDSMGGEDSGNDISIIT